MNVKKIISVATIIVLSLMLSSCGALGTGRYIRDDQKTAEDCLMKIIDTLEKQDKDNLKKMFSSKALETADDIDGGIDYMMDFYRGNIISKDSGACQALASTKFGAETLELVCKYIIITDIDTYMIYFDVIITDKNNPENVGISRLGIIKEADHKEMQDNGESRAFGNVGIYRPKAK